MVGIGDGSVVNGCACRPQRYLQCFTGAAEDRKDDAAPPGRSALTALDVS